MWFEQTRKSSEEGLFPGGKGSEKVTKQPPGAIAGTAPSLFFSLIPFLPWGFIQVAIQPRWSGDRHYSLWCINETFRHLTIIQKDTAVCSYLIFLQMFSADRLQTISLCVTPFHTTTGGSLVPLLLLALTEGVVSHFGSCSSVSRSHERFCFNPYSRSKSYLLLLLTLL